MSHWFHRNPLKATVRSKFDLGTVATTAQARQFLNDTTIKRNKLLEMLENPNNNVESVDEAVNQYISCLWGFIKPPESGSGDSKLRFSLNFRWTQSLSLKGDLPLELADATFELVNMLINIALWYTKHAAKVSSKESVDMEEAKQIHKCLRIAAGIFSDVKNNYISQLGDTIMNKSKGTDIDIQILEAYIHQCTAEAQEITMARAVELQHSPSIIASLAFETSKLFESAALSLSGQNEKAVLKWQRYFEFKSACYRAYAYCYNGEQKLKEDKCGESIAALKEGLKFYQECENKCKEYNKTDGPGLSARPHEHLFFRNLRPLLMRTYEKCERENGLIYHQNVPASIPILELKATYGLVSPETYNLPEKHSLWNTIYSAFDVTKLAWQYGSNKDAKTAVDKKAKEDGQPIPPVKEQPIYQSDKDPTNNSGCTVS